MKNKTKMLSIVLAIVMILTSVSIGVPTFAASKPSATQITSIKAVDNGFKIKWKKKSVTGYQVQYSTSKKFTSKTSKTLKVNKAKTTSKTVKKLKAKKKYYVRVRTYKTVKKKNYYSKWSAKYSVTTKAKKGSSSSSSNVPTIKSVSYLDKGYGFKLTWNKVSKAYGYEIQYSTDKNFSDVYDKDTGYPYLGHYLEVGKNKNSVNFKIDEKDPAGDETWYVRIRAKKNQGSLTTKVKYTGWSKTISILTPERKDYLRLMNKAYNEMGIVATDSDFNKLVKIQRWIDHNWYYSQEINHDDAVEGYGLVKYGYSACGQFANNFKYFLDKTGIQCYVIGGDATNKKLPGHYWNWININGYWYNYDCEVPNTKPLFDLTHKPIRFLNYNFVGGNYILDNKYTNIYSSSNPKASATMINDMTKQINLSLYS
jgi:hypothetical protein